MLGQSFSGKAVEVTKFGVMVDIGMEEPGWLAVSQVQRPEGVTFIEDLTQLVKVKDELTVRALKVKRGGRVELTMMDNPKFQKKPLSDFKAGEVLEGKVVGVMDKCAFVDVGAMMDAVVPKKNLKGATAASLGFEKGKTVKVKLESVTNISLVAEPV